jgi:hypothetical protein
MAEQSRDDSTPKTETSKKQPETVMLTAEELRAISGGQQIPPSGPPAGGKVVVKSPTEPRHG